MIEYLRPAAFPSSQSEIFSAPTSKAYDDIRKDLSITGKQLRYSVPKGTSYDVHQFYDYSKPQFNELGEEVYLPPVLTTFHGHELICPYGVTMTPYSDSRKIRLVLITIHRADGDETKELTVPAWQGDNDTLHLMTPLPDEDCDYGFVKRTVFGKPKANIEHRDWMLGNLYYGDTALLDVDITQIITPGKALRA